MTVINYDTKIRAVDFAIRTTEDAHANFDQVLERAAKIAEFLEKDLTARAG